MPIVLRAALWLAACALVLPPGRPSAALSFTRHDLDPGPYAQVTQGMNVGDLDGDGGPDLVVSGNTFLLGFHNPDWAPFVIAAGYKFGGGAAVAVRDLDGDGRLDVLTGRHPIDHPELRETIWMANRPAGWSQRLLSRVSYCHDLAFGDLDGDGRTDAACADLASNEVSWLAAPADPNAEWTSRPIERHRRVQGIAIADLDRDGDLDVLAGRSWYRNERGDGSIWT